MIPDNTERIASPRVGVGLLALLLGPFAASALGGAGDPPDTSRPIPRIEDYAPPEEFLLAGGVKTHFVCRGTTGRPIVFVHGFGSCTYTWRNNLSPMAARGFRAIAVDVKGFGLTEKPRDGKYHVVAYTEHLLAFLDAMKLDRPLLVGNSMGGAIIARIALLHPGRVSGVVLVDSAPLDFGLRRLDDEPRSAPSGFAMNARLKAALMRSLVSREAVAAGLRGAYFDRKFVTPEAVEVYYRPLLMDGAPEALVAMADPPMEPTPLPPLSGLKVPTLIVWGRHDRVLPVAAARSFVRQIPGARTVILEKSGHMPHEEEADAFNALLAEFAASPPPTPAR